MTVHLFRVYIPLLLLVIMLSWSLSAVAQPPEQSPAGDRITLVTERITLVTDSITARDFISLVEESHGLTFYFDESLLADSLWSAVDFEMVDLEEAVTSFFSIFRINLYMRDRSVYLTGRLVVNQKFASDYHQRIMEESASPTYYINNMVAMGEESATSDFAEFEIIQFGIPAEVLESRRFRLTGRVTSLETGEPVIGTTLQVSGTGLGTATDAEGYYVLTIPAGRHEITIRAIGKLTTHRQISIYAAGKMNVEIAEDITEIEEVVIVGKADDRINTMVGAEKLDLAMVKKSVMVMGETDILKGILAMPGVQTITEVSNGFNVRGGSTDQNLVLIDETPVMNSSHFFGFFSSFNADLVSDAMLYKSGIPAHMGGRISSILDVTSRKGDKTGFGVSAGISPVTARVAVEGPVVKDRISFIAGGRSTYSDWLMNRINDPRINNSSAWFYDLFGNLHADLSEETSLSATVYHSNDYFDFDGFLTHQYSNLAGSVILDTRVARRTTYHTSFTYSDFRFSVTDKYNLTTASRSSYDIIQYGWNNRFTWNRSRWLNLSYGIDGIYYASVPGMIEPSGENSLVVPVTLRDEQAVEVAPFLHNEQNITRWLSLSYGIRFSTFTSLGPDSVFVYDPEFSKSTATITGTDQFGNLEPVKTYGGPEIRFLAKIMTGNKSSVKLSYNRMRQYINLISNTITPAPTDIWKLCDTHFQPQVGNQFSIGYFRDLVKKSTNILTLSLEAYYKTTDHILDYKIGASMFANDHFETEIMEGENRSYGVELQVNKERGSLYGWINYTYARTENRFNAVFPEETINRGTWYPSNHDKPHQVKAVLNYDFYKRLSLSANLNYSTGRPVTLPVTSFEFGGSKRIQFAERNTHRMPDYFRLDLSFTLDGKYNLEKIAHGSFTLSVVNVTGRKNPYSVFFQYDEKGRLKAYYLSIFGVPIPTLTYNLKF